MRVKREVYVIAKFYTYAHAVHIALSSIACFSLLHVSGAVFPSTKYHFAISNATENNEIVFLSYGTNIN